MPREPLALRAASLESLGAESLAGEEEERRGSLTTNRRGSRLSDIILMQVLHPLPRSLCLRPGEAESEEGAVQGQAGVHLAPLQPSGGGARQVGAPAPPAGRGAAGAQGSPPLPPGTYSPHMEHGPSRETLPSPTSISTPAGRITPEVSTVSTQTITFR